MLGVTFHKYNINNNTILDYFKINLKMMKPEQLYQNLIEITEKLNVKVSEKNFRKIGINIQSGFCRVKNKNLFIIDKHLPVFKKNIILANFLNKMPLENIYIMPVVRDFVNKQHRETKETERENFAD